MGIFISKYKELYKNELNTNSNFNRLLNDYKSKVSKLESQVSTLERQNETLKDTVKTFESKFFDLKNKNKCLEADKENIIKTVSECKKTISERAEKNNDLNVIIKGLKAAVEKGNYIIQSFSNERDILVNENFKLREEVKSLQDKNLDLANFITECQENDKIDENDVSIDEPKIDTKIEVTTEEVNSETKLSKSKLKKLRKQGK